MSTRPASIKVRALQWLAQREHSRDELRGKLLRLLQRRPGQGREGEGGEPSDADIPEADLPDTGLPTLRSLVQPQADPAAEVEGVLLWLEAHGYLSQARFVESRVHARQARFGNLRIHQELRQHGVTLDADTQQALQRSEFDRARALWRKKYGGPADDAAARLRQMRFLAGRGFSIDVVRRVLKTGAAHDSDDADGPDS
jgi:regulatory protein